MTERKWKVGDRVICNDPDYGKWFRQDGEIVGGYDGLWVVRFSDGVELNHYSHELIPALESASELDAIERDLKDLFARMRAEIERLK